MGRVRKRPRISARASASIATSRRESREGCRGRHIEVRPWLPPGASLSPPVNSNSQARIWHAGAPHMAPLTLAQLIIECTMASAFDIAYHPGR